MCDGEADDVDSICEPYAAEAHRSAPLRTSISVNLREQLRGPGTARAVSSRTRRTAGSNTSGRGGRTFIRAALPGAAFVPRLARTFANGLRGDSCVLTTRKSYSNLASPTGFESGGLGPQRAVLGRIGAMTAAPDLPDCDRTGANAAPGGHNEPKPKLALEGVVGPALARALVLAAEAQRWELAEQIACELRERRESRIGARKVRRVSKTG